MVPNIDLINTLRIIQDLLPPDFGTASIPDPNTPTITLNTLSGLISINFTTVNITAGSSVNIQLSNSYITENQNTGLGNSNIAFYINAVTYSAPAVPLVIAPLITSPGHAIIKIFNLGASDFVGWVQIGFK